MSVKYNKEKNFSGNLRNYLKNNKYPLIITLIFFLSTSYVSFFIDNPPFSNDALFYFFAGEEILHGNRENVKIPNAPIGGPIIFSAMNKLFQDAYITIKVISLLSGSGIVFLSFFIIKNIFNFKIALVGQLLVSVNPKMHFQSIVPLNEILAVFLIFLSFYYITKKQLCITHLILAAIFVGFSFMIRYQALAIFIGFVIFLLIRDKKIRKNFLSSLLFFSFFLITISPLLTYNYITFGNIIDSDPSFQMLSWNKYQNPEWKEELIQNLDVKSSLNRIFSDLDLFVKNYFYNLFYHTPDRIFNFSFTIDNISPVPLIPFLGMLPILGGAIYSCKIKFKKNMLLFLIGITVATIILVLYIGDISIHFFAIIIIPILVIGILSINRIEKNFLPLLIPTVIFFLFISIVPITRGEHLFSIWLVFPTLTSIFIIETIPSIFTKKISSSQQKKIMKIVTVIVILLLLVNLAFSYKLMRMIEYNDKSYEGVLEEIYKIFVNNDDSFQHVGIESKQIGEILSKQEGIQNSYVMASGLFPAYYTNSKILYSHFTEGQKNETIDSFITRKNWSKYDYYISNISSIPPDRNDIYHPIPDYLVYIPSPLLERPYNLKILEDPTNPYIPSNFELIYKSNKTGAVVYKIQH